MDHERMDRINFRNALHHRHGRRGIEEAYCAARGFLIGVEEDLLDHISSPRNAHGCHPRHTVSQVWGSYPCSLWAGDVGINDRRHDEWCHFHCRLQFHRENAQALPRIICREASRGTRRSCSGMMPLMFMVAL